MHIAMKPDIRENQEPEPAAKDPRLALNYAPCVPISDNDSFDFFSTSNNGQEIPFTSWFGNQTTLDPSQLILQHQQHAHQQPPHQPHFPIQAQAQAQAQAQHQTQRQAHHHHHHHLYAMENGATTTTGGVSQAQCSSSASCPWVLSPVPGDDWSLQQCADIGCIPDVPDVEQCMPSNTARPSSHTRRDPLSLPVPVDFTTTSNTNTTPTSLSQDIDTISSTIQTPARQVPAKAPVSRKRRSSPSTADVPERQTATNAAKPKPVRPAKVAHSVVEQRYRDNLNGKIAQLHKTLSTTKGSGSSSSDEGEAEAALPRTRKADVLASAIDYIRRAEKSRSTLENEVEFLKTRITMLEKLVKCEDCSILTQMNAMRLQQAQFAM